MNNFLLVPLIHTLFVVKWLYKYINNKPIAILYIPCVIFSVYSSICRLCTIIYF